jgi:4-amino-4-deoxy-L-arabinose transferase-like glycosyltransferase
MNLWSVRTAIELVAVITILAGPICVIVERIMSKKGIGARAIQFCAVVMLIPTIILLALEKVLDTATVGTLVGALTGYLLSGVGEYGSQPRQKPKAMEPTEE